MGRGTMWLFVQAGQRKQTVSPRKRSCSGSIWEDHTRLIRALPAVYSKEEEEEEEERIWTATQTCARMHTHWRMLEHVEQEDDLRCFISSTHWTQHNPVIFFGPRQNVLFLLSCDKIAIWTASWVGTLLVYRQTNTLVGWHAERLAGGCCPLEGVALNLALP